MDDSADPLGFVELSRHTEPGEVAGEVAGEVVVHLEHAETLESAGPEHVELQGLAGSQVAAGSQVVAEPW